MAGLNPVGGRLGVFGGTFDPPHIAHLILAAEAYFQLGLDRVLWVLTPNPPHKPERIFTSIKHRLDMVLSAIEDEPKFELSTVDIDRPPPLYAVDTVHLLKQQYPGMDIAYLLGGDSLADLPNWYQPYDFVRSCSQLCVMRRPNDKIDLQVLESIIPGIGSKIRFFSTPMLGISSTLIRKLIRDKRHYRYYLPPTVYQIIRERQLYRSADREEN
jgi:nicotinate-nucleotide adenylyltransferase